MQTIRRSQVRSLIGEITKTGRTFAVECARRTDLFMQYPPTDQFTNGDYCRVGDCSDINTRELIRGGRKRVVLEEKGTVRWMQLTKATNKPSKHWVSKGGKLSFDPKQKQLIHVKGFYNDEMKSDGRKARKGQWRPWAFICERTVSSIKANGQEITVVN